MARALYSAVLLLLLPFIVWFERRRSSDAPGRLAERLGHTRARASGSIWVHAVSMGEVQAAAPLVRALSTRYPGKPIVVTTTTVTGARRVAELFGERVQHAYLPLDLPFAVRAFLDAIEPHVGVVLETELWPNLYAQCAARGVPLWLASARLSERSVGRYRLLNRLFAGLLTRTLAIPQIAAQSAVDRARFIEIGAPAERVTVLGNLKFDVQLPAAVAERGHELRAALGVDRPVWVAGSTHEGEEDVLLQAHAALCAQRSTALLVLVPRHPERFASVAEELQRRGVSFVRRSQGAMPAAEHSVVLVDAMGELQAFYAAGDIAYVGGTLIPRGGHNLLEPAALGRPVLCGPHTFNAPDIAAQLREAGALREVGGAGELATVLSELFREPMQRQRMGRAGQDVIGANRGACAALVQRAAQALDG